MKQIEINNKKELHIYSTLGAIAGISEKIRTEYNMPEQIAIWMKRVELECHEYLVKMGRPTAEQITQIAQIMEKYFCTYFTKEYHILTMINFFMVIISDLGVYDTGTRRISRALNKLHGAVTLRYKDKALCQMAGIRVGEAWNEAFVTA